MREAITQRNDVMINKEYVERFGDPIVEIMIEQQLQAASFC
jgi:hypothetical protein